MRCLGIIGTAGRGSDGENLRGYWKPICTIAQVTCELLQIDSVVSGGASWADHIAVRMFLDGHVKNLTLHLAAEFTPFGFKETSSKYDCGRTSNYYHNLFRASTGVNSIEEIRRAIEKGAVVKSAAGGFKERNTDIANQADVMLAYTFGDGAVLKNGGTKDTMTKFLSRRGNPIERQVESDGVMPAVAMFSPFAAHAYHFDLTSKALYTL